MTIDQHRTKQNTKGAHVISKIDTCKNYQNYIKEEIRIKLLN